MKLLVPEFKLGETRWPERLAALRERLKTGPKVHPKALRLLGRSDSWLLPALLAEAKQGPHPGTSLLEVEVEALPGGGLSLALKSEYTACMRQVAVVLRDFAPESEIAEKLARPIAKGDNRGYEKVFVGCSAPRAWARGRASTRCWPRPRC
ncbi:hypothetical protein [Nannocystis pusilla]|uniref:hypothetical protein n=1 Tax=Nannocystis pusilla TaxID=889268 RepID=UPI003B7FEDE9